MSHSSGIKISESLKEVFAKARNEKDIRYVKFEIIDEKLVESAVVNKKGTEKEDFDTIQEYLKPEIPAYVGFNRDDDSWVMLTYVPDGSKIKARMLYASTRDTARKETGTAIDMYGTTKDEFTYDQFLEFVSNRQNNVNDLTVLTETERIQKEEDGLEVAQGIQSEYVHSVQFPVATAALNALKDMVGGGSKNCVLLTVESKTETIEFMDASPVTVKELSGHIPALQPVFCFYRWDHEKDGAKKASLVFIYSCPDNSPIKMRMLFSTVKSATIAAAGQAGVELVKSLEVTSPSEEVSEEWLTEEIYPKAAVKEKTFSKPARPGRGKARMHAKK